MVQNLKAILFDMDGVLVNSEFLHQKAWITLLKNKNLELPPVNSKNFIGATDLSLAIKVKSTYPKLSENEYDLIKLKQDIFISSLPDENLSSPAGRNHFLEHTTKNIRKAVVSSCSRMEIMSILQSENILHYFEFIVGIEDTKHHKPAPDPYLFALKSLQLSKKEVIIFEDSLIGITAAIKSGIKVFGMATSFNKLVEYPEIEFYESYNDIPF